jgi:hypothetical protein
MKKKIFLTILGFMVLAIAATIFILGFILIASPEILGAKLTVLVFVIAMLLFAFFGVIGTDLIRDSYDN